MPETMLKTHGWGTLIWMWLVTQQGFLVVKIWNLALLFWCRRETDQRVFSYGILSAPSSANFTGRELHYYRPL